MRPSIGFRESQAKIRKTLNALAQKAAFVPKKTIRTRPRDIDETMALCRAVAISVREAKLSGRLRKTTEGYIVSWKR